MSALVWPACNWSCLKLRACWMGMEQRQIFVYGLSSVWEKYRIQYNHGHYFTACYPFRGRQSSVKFRCGLSSMTDSGSWFCGPGRYKRAVQVGPNYVPAAELPQCFFNSWSLSAQNNLTRVCKVILHMPANTWIGEWPVRDELGFFVGQNSEFEKAKIR